MFVNAVLENIANIYYTNPGDFSATIHCFGIFICSRKSVQLQYIYIPQLLSFSLYLQLVEKMIKVV